ncbi:MAG: hypothetical protein ACJ0DG_06300 [bacterium]
MNNTFKFVPGWEKSWDHRDCHLDYKDSASTERYSHLSAEETFETGAAISKKLYG